MSYEIVKLTTDLLMEIDKLKQSGIKPSLIILTPVDYLMLREKGEVLNKKGKRVFFNIEVIRSGDIEVGTFLIK